VLDEEPTLLELVERLEAALGPLGGFFELIVVDDGSRDGTWAALVEMVAAHPSLRAIRLSGRFGKSAALAAGFDAARGEVLVMLDGDLQDRPEEIPALLQRLEAGADLVTGRKRRRQDPWTRRLASRVFNGLISVLSGVRVQDSGSGLKAMRARVFAELWRHRNFHRFLPWLAAARGFRVEEVDVVHDPRRHGRSRYGWRRYLEGLVDLPTILFRTRSRRRPLHPACCYVVAETVGDVAGAGLRACSEIENGSPSYPLSPALRGEG